jgi:translation elongation factor P/translation initiation factor 5A
MTDLKKLKKGNYIIHENEACVIKEVQMLPSKNNPVIKLELEGLFSGKHYHSHILTHQFETFEASIDPMLLDKAKEGDNVTYVHSDTSTKILEVRK